MSILLGQHVVKVDAFVGGTTSNPTAAPTTTGSTFVIAIASTSAALTVSDNMGNTYTPSSTPAAIGYNGTFRNGYLFYCQNGNGGSGHTFSCAGGTSESIVLFGVELLNAATSGGPNANTTPVSSSAAPLVVQSITPSVPNTLVLNFAGVISAAAAASSGTGGWSLVDSGQEASFGTGGALSYNLVGAPAAVNDTLTVTDSSQYASFAIAFASGGAPVSQGDQLTNQTFMSMSRGFR